MMSVSTSILTINGGSSSIKFALCHIGEALERKLVGKVDRIGLSGTNLTFNDPSQAEPGSRSIEAADHGSAANFLIDWLEQQVGFTHIRAVGHRVHGMQHTEPEQVSQALLDELHRISRYDPDHLPRENEYSSAWGQCAVADDKQLLTMHENDCTRPEVRVGRPNYPPRLYLIRHGETEWSFNCRSC